MFPACARSTTPSENISVWTPRSCLSPSRRSTASGMAPMPICSVAPSSTSAATWRPIVCSTSSGSTPRMNVEWTRRAHERVNAAERHQGVAERARHLCVDFRDDQARALRGGERGIDRRAERAVTVAVRRRELEEGHVDSHLARQEQRGNVGQEDRHEVRVPAIDGVAHGRPGEEGHGAKAATVLGSRKRCRTAGVQVIQRDILQIAAPRERFEQGRRRGGGAMNEDVHTAADARDRVVGGALPCDPSWPSRPHCSGRLAVSAGSSTGTGA